MREQLYEAYSEAVACEIEHEMGEMRPRQLCRETRRGRCEYQAEFRKLLSAKLNFLKCISWQKFCEPVALDVALHSAREANNCFD